MSLYVLDTDILTLFRLKVRKMDLQIAATALEHGSTVVTRNVRDFKAVPGLTVEDWGSASAKT